MAKSSTSRKKQKRSSATRLDSSFARPRMRAKAFFLAVGIMGGALVAAGVKSFIQADQNEIEISEESENVRPQAQTHNSSRTRSYRTANTSKTVSKPKLNLVADTTPEQVEEVKQEAPKAQAKLEPVKAKSREKSYSAAPKRKAIAIVAAQPVPVLSAPAVTPTVAIAPSPAPVSVVRPKTVTMETLAPVKVVAVKKIEERPQIEEIPILTLSEEPRREQAIVMKEKPKKLEVKEKAIKESPKLASHVVKDENFRSRLKKTKKIELVETEVEEVDTATSPFQDRLRKSLK